MGVTKVSCDMVERDRMMRLYDIKARSYAVAFFY